MNDLDLDIYHYSIYDMECFFKLVSKQNYTKSDIEYNESEIRTKLLSSGQIDKVFKRDLIEFLNKVKSKLMQELELKENNTLKKSKSEKYQPNVNYPSNIQYPPPSREKEMVEKPISSFLYTQPSPYFPGIMNPLNTRTLSKSISIDSRFRDNLYTTKSSDFSIFIPNKIQKVVSIKLTSIEISPHSILNISSSLGNNYLYIQIETKDSVIINRELFILPDGQYSTDKIIDKLNELLNLKNNLFSSLIWKIDENGSGKIILYTENPLILSISLDFSLNKDGNMDNNTDFFRKLGRILGFTKRKYSQKEKYISETAANPYFSLYYFFLDIDDFQNHSAPSFITAFSQNNISTSVLARITLPKIEFVSESRQYFGPIDIARLQIRLLDVYGRVLDLNGADYSFCISLNVIYDL